LITRADEFAFVVKVSIWSDASKVARNGAVDCRFIFVHSVLQKLLLLRYELLVEGG
jgi:hypothetical protein